MKKRNIPKRAIFLDRDGVINQDKGYVYRRKDFEFEKNALKGLKLIDFNQYLVFIVCNQAGIAHGYYTKNDCKKLHQWLRKYLLKKGIKITKIYYCPHHPKGKIKRFSIKCSCRKPEPGMLLRAKKEYGINFKKSYLIGDKTSDILAGKRAGCKCILVKTGYGGKDKLFSVKPDYVAKDLLEAVKIINSQESD